MKSLMDDHSSEELYRSILHEKLYRVKPINRHIKVDRIKGVNFGKNQEKL